MLKLENIHVYYGKSHILYGISMGVKKGSITVLLGRNGMGKTTTIHTIMGFLSPTDGEIRFKEKRINGLEPYKIARMGISHVPQGRRIFKDLTVEENLIIGSGNRKSLKIGYGLNEIYSMFPILEKRAKTLGGNLSGGEQQMLSFARALITNPELMLMDEPFEGLAPEVVKELINKIRELKNAGITILLVEQNIQTALSLADYVYIINKGRIAFKGTPEDIKSENKIIDKFILV